MNRKTNYPMQNSNDFVSVIMPCFNAQAFLDEAIHSVVKQTYENWELLVLDDGSSDQSKEVALKWERKDNRVRLVPNEKNMGVSKTRNRGIDLSSSQWIAFLDSDDVWEEEKLERQVELAREHEAEFVFTACSIIDKDSNRRGEMTNIPELVTFNELQKWNCITCSSVLLSRRALGSFRFEHDDSREDYLLWLRILTNIRYAHSIKTALVRYRVIGDSRSSNKVKMIRDTYRVHRHLGTHPITSCFNTLTHFINAFIRKYRNIVPRD